MDVVNVQQRQRMGGAADAPVCGLILIAFDGGPSPARGVHLPREDTDVRETSANRDLFDQRSAFFEMTFLL